MGPTALRYLDAILGDLRSAGFSIENATHAFWLLDSYVYGHVIQDQLAVHVLGGDDRVGRIPSRADHHERIPASRRDGTTRAEVAYSFETEFEYGLDLIPRRLGPDRDRGDWLSLRCQDPDKSVKVGSPAEDPVRQVPRARRWSTGEANRRLDAGRRPRTRVFEERNLLIRAGVPVKVVPYDSVTRTPRSAFDAYQQLLPGMQA